jgi:hypothetical protein
MNSKMGSKVSLMGMAKNVSMKSQSNEPKKVFDHKEKYLKHEKCLCFVILSHGNLLDFHSYECQGIQTKILFDENFN